MSKILATIALLFTTVAMWGEAAERYVVLDGFSGVARVHNASDNSQVAVVRAGPLPNSAVISPNGRLLFVAAEASQYVSVIDLTINAEIKRIQDVGPDQLAMSADGKTIVATSFPEEAIIILDATTLSVRDELDLNGKAGDDPNVEDLGLNVPVILGNKAYLNTSNDIIVVDLNTLAVTPLSGSDDAFFFQSAENLAASPDGKILAAIRAGGLVLMDTTTNAPVLTVPFGFAFSVTAGRNPANPSKMVAYVANAGSSAVLSMVDITSGSPTFGSILAEAPLPSVVPKSQRTQVNLNPAGTRLYVSVSATVASSNPNVFIVDTASLLTNPGGAVTTLPQETVQPRSIVIGATQNQPPSTAPVVTGIDKREISNGHASTLEVFGSGFVPGENVKVGGIDPIPATFVSSNHLRVNIPANAPSQVASIIVTTPNSDQDVSRQHQSGILRNALTISTPENLNLPYQVGAANFGDSSFTIISKDDEDGLTSSMPTPRPSGLAMSPDGSRMYIANQFSPASVEVFNFNTHSIEAHVTLNGERVSLPGQSRGIFFAPNIATGKLAAWVVASRVGNLDLYAIDADPSSPTFNTVVADIPTNISTAVTSPDSFVMSPDGRFAFVDELDIGDVGANLLVVNIATQAVTVIPAPSINMLPFQLTMDISADGKYLVVVSKGDNFLVLDVSNPTHPVVVTTLVGALLPGIPKVILEFPRIVGNRLFAFDIDHNVVSVFNFNPAAGDFTELGNFLIPGPTAVITAVADVTPDGKFIYYALREEDSVAILDVDKIVQHDPSALVTKIGVGLTPEFVAVRPLAATQTH